GLRNLRDDPPRQSQPSRDQATLSKRPAASLASPPASRRLLSQGSPRPRLWPIAAALLRSDRDASRPFAATEKDRSGPPVPQGLGRTELGSVRTGLPPAASAQCA